jgi:ribosome-associated heat shock protein Hsp15
MADSSRIDKWLFCARFYRTRALAQAAAGSGRLRLNGSRVEKPAQPLGAVVVLSLGRGGLVSVLKVFALGERRGPASVAQSLYQRLD